MGEHGPWEGPDARVRLIAGDCRPALAQLADCSIDAVCTDPPGAIDFMGEAWDRFAGGLLGFQDFIAEVFTDVYRALKPGGHILVWAIPRTAHHTAMGVERAGFEVRDVVVHLFGTGFPKSLDVSKAIDKSLGAERTEVVGVKAGHEDFIERTDAHAAGGRSEGWDRPWSDDPEAVAASHMRFAPATDEAGAWQGWGTALKPAAEHWILARKPIGATVAANVLEHGTGALNIDGCRIGDGKGRWPADVVLSHHPDCELLGDVEIVSDSHHPARRGAGNLWAGHHGQDELPERAPGRETVPNWRCTEDCPVRLLDEHAGIRRSGKPGRHRLGVNTSAAYGIENRKPGTPMSGYGDVGAASRFYFVAKPSRSERDAGAKNFHPTVKPIALMRWLCRLITPPDGIVLDPFMGSGTTGIACVQEGFRFVGIERRDDYLAIAQARIAHTLSRASNQETLFEDLG